MEHVLRAQQFDKKLIAQVFDVAEEMERVVAVSYTHLTLPTKRIV